MLVAEGSSFLISHRCLCSFHDSIAHSWTQPRKRNPSLQEKFTRWISFASVKEIVFYWSILTEVDKIFPRWYTAKSRKPFCGSKRPQVFRFFTAHRQPLCGKASSRSTQRYTEQSTWRGRSKIRKIAEVFHFTHLGPVTPRAQGHSIVALQLPSSVLKHRPFYIKKIKQTNCSPPNTVIGIETSSFLYKKDKTNEL